MESVNLVGEKGFGPWLKSLRNKRKWTVQETAQAASVGESTVLRYEKDQGPSYELLRLMDALGVKLRPALPKGSAGSLNTEIRRLSDRLVAIEATVDRSGAATTSALEDLTARLQRVENELGLRDAQATEG